MSKRSNRLSPAPLWAAVLLAVAGGAQATDFSGYFRGGPGLTKKNTSRACYHLNEGAGNSIARGLNYRLGNECDIYGEFQIDQNYSKDGIDYGGTVMVTHYTNATDNDGSGLNFEQLFAHAKGLDVLPEATFWIGKSRGRRGDVHIVDWFFTDMKGVGAGVKGISVGSGKLGMAWYKTDGDSSDTRPGNRLNLEVLGIDSNPGGKANLFFTLTKGDFSGGTSGLGLSLRHDQARLFGTSINNTLWVQAASGSTSLESNFGDLTRKSSAKSFRIVESINWQSGAFGGQALALVGTSEDNAGKRTTATTLGGRISYGVTRNFKMVVEAGASQYKTEGQSAARLSKVTIAPTLSINNEFWSRPELRLYVTTAKWNAAAGNVTGVAGFADKTSGTSAGAQVEWWF
ncbi:carbohydrate porin [Ideonella sp. A 288]|uniref:maltoporin n=1 Tax=Ideonella sp. A 288 TaxID=1962181 RepID=UPI0013038E64|nr:carbohydrate porin [Ideonella sp. A 288]